MTPLRVGDSRTVVVCDEVTRTRIMQYAGASGDFSELHTDEPAARSKGHRSVMAHGMMTMAMTGQVVADWFGPAALHALSSRFTAPVWPGDRLTTTATVESIETIDGEPRARLSLKTTNDEGLTVLSGEATVGVARA